MISEKIEVPTFVYRDIKIDLNNHYKIFLQKRNELDGVLFLDKKIKTLIAKIIFFKKYTGELVNYKEISTENNLIEFNNKNILVFGYNDEDPSIYIDKIEIGHIYVFIKITKNYSNGQITLITTIDNLLNFLDEELNVKHIRINVDDLPKINITQVLP